MKRVVLGSAAFGLLGVLATVTGFAATLGVESGTIDTFSDAAAATTTTTTAVPSGTSLYLKTSTAGQDVASSTPLTLSSAAPTQGTLYNYDTNRDASPGLLIQKGTSQRWLTAGPLPATSGSFTFWSQMKDGANNKKGSVRIHIRACASDLTGCTTMLDADVAPNGAWDPTKNAYVAKTVTFTSPVSTDLGNNTRRLVVDVYVLGASGDDMWFAYDTTAHPSVLVLR